MSLLNYLLAKGIQLKDFDMKTFGKSLRTFPFTSISQGDVSLNFEGSILEVRPFELPKFLGIKENEISHSLNELSRLISSPKFFEVSNSSTFNMGFNGSGDGVLTTSLYFKLKDNSRITLDLSSKYNESPIFLSLNFLAESEAKNVDVEIINNMKDTNSIILVNYFGQQGSDGNIFLASKSAKNSFISLRTFMETDSSLNTEVRLLPLLNSNLDFDFYSFHKGINSKNLIEIKSLLLAEANLSMRGLIKVFPKSENTNAIMNFSSLNLSETARIVEIPRLEIENNEVVTTHSASSISIEPEQVFYLMSRGFSLFHAIKEITLSFFSYKNFEMENFLGEDFDFVLRNYSSTYRLK